MAALREQDRPVGILDSGIGGFSVARQVQRLMPGEELLYLGDGAHIPYGNHREEEIVAMARYLFRFMEEHGSRPFWWPVTPSPASSTGAGRR